VPGRAFAMPRRHHEARHPKVLAVLGLDAFQVDYGVAAAAAALKGAGNRRTALFRTRGVGALPGPESLTRRSRIPERRLFCCPERPVLP
jgi:hypothetical protein